jgi:chromosome condensin MukBEF complex kleisin-like MukF subunit
MRRPGASFSNVQLVSGLISMIQLYRKNYFDVCWVPLNNQRRLIKFTAEFLIVTSQQMTWKVTAELKYNLRQEIVDFIIPPYEVSLLAMQAKRSRLLGMLFSLKKVVSGKKKQKKYTSEELKNIIRVI